MDDMKQTVEEIFSEMLGRKPDDATIASFGKMTAPQIAKSVALSYEFVRKNDSRIFAFEAQSTFSLPETIRSFSKYLPNRVEGSITNFLGVQTRTSFLSGLDRFSGITEQAPIPQNFHADMAEWGAALRAVSLAKEKFSVVELGAGWSPWAVSTMYAAKSRGLQVEGVAVEAELHYGEKIRQHCLDNALPEIQVFGAPITAVSHWMLFTGTPPFSPISFSSQDEAEAALGSMSPERKEVYRLVKTITLEDILSHFEMLDLLHVDVQGFEEELFVSNIDLLCEKVAFIVVGTHSRTIEGNIISLLSSRGWELEVEKPCRMWLGQKPLRANYDGTQGWRNSNLIETSR